MGQDSDDQQAHLQRRAANYALAMFFVVTFLNFLDRQLISILAEPIKADLGLSDTQIGLMTGLSFAIFYTLMGIPIAALADQWNRSKIIAIAITIWSAMTALCGVAGNFMQMFLARIGVGVGEAGATPPIHSLVADIFPPERRAGVFGILGVSVPLGSFIAYAAGGWVVENLSWRLAFLIAAAPGIALGLLMWFTVPDPRPHPPLMQSLKPQPGQITLRAALAELSLKPTYWYLVAAGCVVQFVAYGMGSFYGSFFVRVHGMGYADLGFKLGLMVFIAGGLGAYIGGRVGNKLVAKNPAYPLLISGVIMLLAVPAAFIGLRVSSPNMAFLCFSMPVLAATFYYGPTFSAVQSLASARTRAMAAAIYVMIAGLLGLGLGPVFVGGLSDTFMAGGATTQAALVKALSALVCFNALGFGFYMLAARTIKRDTRDA